LKNSPITSPPSQPSLIVRWIALVSWILIVLANLLFFLFDSSSDYSQMLVPCADGLGFSGGCNFLAISPAEVAVLSSWGLTLQTYAFAMLISPVILLLVYWALGGLILWRQGLSWLGLTVSLALIILPISTISGSNDWSANDPTLFFLAVSVALLANAIMVGFLYLLPNGRFSPKWAYVPLASTILFMSVLLLENNDIINISAQASSLLQTTTFSLVLFGGGLQVYRYLRDSNLVERQQTKWIVFGILSYVLSVMVWVLIFGGPLAIPAGKPRLLANLGGWFFMNLFLLLILPAAITIAILRYKLWNIDLIIRKTLVYALLSGMLALVYIGTVILLQSVFDSFNSQQSPFVIVISTLVIAALFAPLRRRVQAFIDRRFYRQKYDAQQVLAHFAQIARHEVSLDTLTTELSYVVQETMQPERISIWLKPPHERN
jgi:hypothetical protein